jgi:predicted metal-dependent hydrolase
MNKIPYKIVRSDRKTIALVIDSEANLVVRAPRRTKESEIADFVEKKKRWIAEKQHQVSVFGEKHSPIILETGESLLYLGNTYTILRKRFLTSSFRLQMSLFLRNTPKTM